MAKEPALRKNRISNGPMWPTSSRTPIAMPQNESSAPAIHRIERRRKMS
jgi:hypothetical protein